MAYAKKMKYHVISNLRAVCGQKAPYFANLSYTPIPWSTEKSYAPC